MTRERTQHPPMPISCTIYRMRGMFQEACRVSHKQTWVAIPDTSRGGLDLTWVFKGSPNLES